jgi:hypothetical protein
MPSRCEQILQHLTGTTQGAGILGAAAGVGGRVYRDRAEAFAQAELPALVVLPEADDPTPGFTSCRTRWLLTVRIYILITGGAVSRLADPTRVSIHQILMADTTLGGLATAVRPLATRWQPDKGNEGPGVVDMGYQIDYVTRENDLTI